MSTGAATTIFTQMVVMPPLIQATGEHVSCTLGLLILMTGLSGMSLLRVQPWHMALYLLIRVGTGITDTATATLVTLNSNSSSQRATNLGLVQSTRAAARIVTSVLSGSLFSLSCFSYGRFPGCLPYLVNAVLALALTPLPLLLKKLEQRQAEE
jgi:MFS family permease